MTHMDKAAQRKIGIEGWEPCIYEGVTGGTLITGGIPVTSGGKKKWPRAKLMDRVLLTPGDVEEEERRYEAETCKCHVCYGKGKEVVGWNRDTGHRYRECPRCKGTGTAP